MITVLLADDHPALLAGVRATLDADPRFAVVAAVGDGASALDAAREMQPDVAVLDVDLPGLSGVEVAHALRGTAVRVVAFTAHAGRGFVRGLRDAGAAGYVTKDQPEHVLADAIVTVAEGGTYWPDAAADGPDLTERQHDILLLLARGLSNPAIAETLFLSEGTVRNTLTAVYGAIGVATRAEAVAWAWAHGLGAPRR